MPELTWDIYTRGDNMISKDMIVDDILYKHPQLEKVFKSKGIKCFGWGGVLYMTVEQVALMYELNAEALVEELNSAM